MTQIFFINKSGFFMFEILRMFDYLKNEKE